MGGSVVWIVVPIVLTVGIGVGAVVWAQKRTGLTMGGGPSAAKLAEMQRLTTEGTKCRATILGVAPTGMIVNNLNIEVNLTAQFEPIAGGPQVQGTKRLLVPQTMMPRIGEVVPAFVDPADPNKFALVEMSQATPEQIPLFREFGIPHPLDTGQ